MIAKVIKYNPVTGENECVNQVDDMPNQQDVVDNRNLIRLLIKRLFEQGVLQSQTNEDLLLINEANALPNQY